MRVTSNLFPGNLKEQLQALQQEQFRLQNQLASGLRFTRPSEAPAEFAAAQRLGERQAAGRAWLKSTDDARDLGNYNHAAMTDLQRVLARASELVFRAGGATEEAQRRIIGGELGSLLDQVVGIANRQRDGNSLFGGTGNVPPVVTASAGPPPVYAYNAAPEHTATTTRSAINVATTVETGLVAGRAGSFDGFLASGGDDTLAALTSLRDTLLAGGTVDSAAAPAQGLRRGLDRAGEFVGRTAARLSVLQLNESSLQDLIQGGAEALGERTRVNAAEAITDLQRVQFNYQAALQSGASILQLNLMNYLRL